MNKRRAVDRQRESKAQHGNKPRSRTSLADDPVAYARFKCNWLGYWRKCADKRCARHHACSGDAEACFERHWWQESQEFRSLLFFTIKFMKERHLPYQEALNAAYKHLASFLQQEAEGGWLDSASFRPPVRQL